MIEQDANWFERAANLRAGEGRLAFLGAAQFFLLMFAYFMLRPLREAMGLDGRVAELSTLFLINVGVMAVLNPVYGWVTSRVVKRRLTLVVYRVAIACLGVFAVLVWENGGTAPAAVGPVFYVWLSVLNVFIISLFWSRMVDLQGPAQSRRVFGVVAVGGTLGAMAGSAWAWGFVETLGPFGMMVCAAALLEVGARVSLLYREPERRGPARERIGGSAWAGLAAMARSPYLLAIGLYILMHTSASTFVYFEKMSIVETASASTAERTELFSQIQFFGQLLTVTLQLLLTGRMLRWFGVGALMCVVPAITLAGFVSLEFASTVAVITVFEGVRNSAHYALGKPSRETLFTVLPTEDKYKAKAALDTFVYRGGDAASALAHQAVARAAVPFLWVIAPLCAVSIAVSLWLGRQESRRERGGAAQPQPPHGVLPDAATV